MNLTRTSLGIAAVAAMLALLPASHAQTNTPPRGRPANRQAGMRGSADMQLTRLTEQLQLTDAQKPKVKAVLEAQQKKFQELRADTAATPENRRAKMQAIQEDYNKKMKEILTPEQLKKLEEQQQQIREQRRNGAPGGAAGNGQNRNRARPAANAQQ